MLLLHVVVKGAVRFERFVADLANLRVLLGAMVRPTGRALARPSGWHTIAHLGQEFKDGLSKALMGDLHVLLEGLDTLAHGAALGAEEPHELGS